MNVTVLRHGPFYSDPRVVKECLALCDAGHDVTVLCRGSTSPWISHPRLRVQHVRGEVSERPLWLASQSMGLAIRSAIALLRGRPPDVVVVHSIPSWLVFGAATARLRNRKTRILLDHHEPEAEMIQEAGMPAPMVRLYRFVERAALRFADGVVDVSPEMAERSRNLGARAQVVVDNAPLIVNAEERADEGPWDLAVFGSLIPRYDLAAVAEALSLLPSRVDVIQIGRGPAALSENASGGRFLSVPYSPPPVLQAHLRSTRFGFVGLAPSDFTDYVSPNRLWELVSLGVPAIVAETALTRRLLGEDAIFYRGGSAASLAEAIERAQQMERPAAEAMANAARNRLGDRLWERQAQEFVEFCCGTATQKTRR